MSWSVEWCDGSAADFHARPIPEHPSRAVWSFGVQRPALVLGSTQDESIVDFEACRRDGVEVVRRRSGGGAVLLTPGDVSWIDVIIPHGDPLWEQDVGRSMWWLGEIWAETLEGCGVVGARVHRGPLVSNAWSRLVCFAGLGPGEITVGSVKLVGVSQRRTRAAARFQCAVYRSWNAAAIVGLLNVDALPDEELPPVATIDVAPAGLVDTFIQRLEALSDIPEH